MILTPRSQGYRFRQHDWSSERYIDVKRVGRSTVTAIDQNKRIIEFDRDDTYRRWERLGGTTRLIANRNRS